MAWVRIEDRYPRNPKVREAGPKLAYFHICALCHCAEHETDGFVSVNALPEIGLVAGVTRTKNVVNALINAGLWREERPGSNGSNEKKRHGWWLKDYLDFNPSAAQMVAKREAAAKRQAEYRANRNAETNGVTAPVANATPIPPQPSPKEKPLAANAAGESGDEGLARSRPRKRDELWDALIAELGSPPATRSERGRWNRALKELREAGASPDDVKSRCAVYRRRWPGVSLTPTALSSNWGSLAANGRPKCPCPECGLDQRTATRLRDHLANVHEVSA